MSRTRTFEAWSELWHCSAFCSESTDVVETEMQDKGEELAAQVQEKSSGVWVSIHHCFTNDMAHDVPHPKACGSLLHSIGNFIYHSIIAPTGKVTVSLHHKPESTLLFGQELLKARQTFLCMA